MSSKTKKTIVILLALCIVMTFAPLFFIRGASFGGSDDAGSGVIEEINGGYEPWFTPVFETLIGGELPGEAESLLFSLQTGIGTGVIAFSLGRMVERKKWLEAQEKENNSQKEENCLKKTVDN